MNPTEEQPAKKSRLEGDELEKSLTVDSSTIENLFQIDSDGIPSDFTPNIHEAKVEFETQLVPSCKYFALGTCSAGSECRFRHESKIPTMCQYFLKGNCRLGLGCRFMHQQAPCKFFQSLRGCKNAKCPFAHIKEALPVVVPGGVGASKILDKYSSVKLAESKGVSDLQTRSLV